MTLSGGTCTIENRNHPLPGYAWLSDKLSGTPRHARIDLGSEGAEEIVGLTRDQMHLRRDAIGMTASPSTSNTGRRPEGRLVPQRRRAA
jgi:hypothetical protein